MPRVAVIGSGISGLATAWQLAGKAEVTLFEASGYFGGHTHTVDLTLDGLTHGVDTGFLVFNQRTYPQLVRLFETLEVRTATSEMSFSVQVPGEGLEWSGSSLNAVFAQRRNLVRPAFLRMLADLLRFNRITTGLADSGAEAALQQDIASFLDQHRFGEAFRRWYLLPMIGCIWSCPTEQMLRFPIATLIRFCHNHGLLQVSQRPQWYTVAGGARHYVQALLRRIPDARLDTPVRAVIREGFAANDVRVVTDRGSEGFDDVVFACHSDQALALLKDASPSERAVLGAIGYHANRAVLHTDASLLPKRRSAWAAWNHTSQHAHEAAGPPSGICLHYLINKLQPLPWRRPVIVSLNPVREPDPSTVHGRFEYSHPVFDLAALRAQRLLPGIQGRRHAWYAGAWTRYGFHEDGLMSASSVVEAMTQAQLLRGPPSAIAERSAVSPA